MKSKFCIYSGFVRMLKNFSDQPIEETGWGREVGYPFLSDRVIILSN